jgi:hypothetical protein
VSAALIVAGVMLLLVAAFFAFRAVRRFWHHAGQRVDRLADPRPFPEEQGRRTDPDPDLRYFRPAPEIWPPQITDQPPGHRKPPA